MAEQQTMATPVTAAPNGPGGIPAELLLGLDPEQRRTVRWCLALMGALATGGMLGGASALYLVNHAPLLLVALSPIGRHLLLVAPIVDPLLFVLVVVPRRLLFQIPSFRLGRALGPRGLAWLELRAVHFARLVRWFERLFLRAPALVLLCLPRASTSSIAGSAGMAERRFIALITAGNLLRLGIVIALGEALREPIEGLLAWIDRWWKEGTALILIGVALTRWRQGRRQRVRIASAG